MNSDHFDWKTVYTKPSLVVATSETVVLTLSGFLIGYWLAPEQPFFSASTGLSWLIIGPLLSGLRYGLSYALVSLSILMMALVIAHYQALPWAAGSYTTIGLGLLLISMAAGEFRNAWDRRTNLLYQTTDYLDKRLNEVTAAFNVMKLSHDRMEQEFASDTSLRSRLLLLRQHMISLDNTEACLGKMAPLIMKDFIQFGDIKEAEIYQVEKERILPKSLASVGFETSAEALALPINLNNRLIQEALKKHQTISLKSEFLNQDVYDSSILLVVALVGVHNKLWGLLVIKKMAFRAFNSDNIRDLAVIGQEIGNILDIQSQSGNIRDTELQQFIIQLKQCMKNLKTHDLPSTLIGLELTNKLTARRARSMIERYKRHLDQIWVTRNQSGNSVLFVLMPFGVRSGARGYLRRLEKALEQQTGFKNLTESGVVAHTHALKTTDTVPGVMQTLTKRCGVTAKYEWD